MKTHPRVAALHGRARRRQTEVDRLWTRLLVILRRIGRHRTIAVVAFGVLGVAGSSAVSSLRGGALPAVHDEFSYLLAADTFAAGRLTNPPHKHWEHFETYHVLVQPTYASKYPPAQGLVLALGQVTIGSPEVGVWLSAGAMAAATAWMLSLWLPPHWALLTSILFTLQMSWISYWSHSYWGGAVAATGGALAFGAFRAFATNRPNMGLGLILGVGLGILALSRPYEGAVAGVCLAAALAFHVASVDRSERLHQIRSMFPAAGVVVAVLLWHGYYNWRVTGSPLSMPYEVYQEQYSGNPLLLVGDTRPRPTYRHADMERFFTNWGEPRRERQRSLMEQLRVIPMKLASILGRILGVCSLALLGLPGIMGRGPLRFAVVTTGAVIGASLLTAASHPHYVAPAASLMYVIAGVALCYFHRNARRKRSTNLAIVLVLLFLVYLPFGLIGTGATSRHGAFAEKRAAIVRQLESLPDRSLVFVIYATTHDSLEEWVYNRADIDSARIVWARSMGSVRDQQLIEYFGNRKVWRFAPDEGLSLQPYSPRANASD